MELLRDKFLQEMKLASLAGDTKIGQMVEKVSKNETQVAIQSLYMAKGTGGSTTIRMTDPSDVKTLGVRNFAQARPAASFLMLVTAIRVLGVELGAGSTINDAAIQTANYGSIKGLTGLPNGEVDIYSDGKIIVKDFPMYNFITDNKQTIELGTIHLGAPKFVFPDAELKAEIRTGAQTSATGIVKIELIGIATVN